MRNAIKPAPSRSLPAGGLSGTLLKGLHLFLLALVTLAAYSNAFHTPFYFDDFTSIVQNGVIRDLGRFFSGEGYAFNPRRVVGYLTFALNYSVGGLDPFGYHVVNVATHVLCGWLVYFLVGTLLKTPFFAGEGSQGKFSLVPLFAALLFVAHPVQTQAVTYIVQRLASLVTLFYLVSLVCYLKGRIALAGKAAEGEGGAACTLRPVLYFLGSLAAAVLALRTKEIAATLPLAILLCEFSFFKPSRKRNLLLTGSLLLFALLVAAAVMTAGKPLGEILTDVNELSRETKTISRGEYLLTQFSVIATYLRLLFLPVNQNLDYHYPVFSSLFAPRVFLSLLLLLSLCAGAVWLHLRSAVCGFTGKDQAELPIAANPGGRLVAFGVFWFFITLSVESSVIPISDVIFEHRLYLPAVGAFASISAGAALLAGRTSPRAFAAAIAVVTLVLAAATWNRNLVWESPVTLWGDVVSKSSEKSRPNNQYGVALAGAGRTEEAMQYLNKALYLNPENGHAFYNLGRTLDSVGNLELAIQAYGEAIRLLPGLAAAHNNLAVDHLLVGEEEKAIERFKVALSIEPSNPDAHNNLGFVLMKRGRIDEAIRHYQEAIRSKGGFVKAYNNLGAAYQAKGELDLAIGQFQEAVRLSPGDETSQQNLARALGLKQSR